MTATAQSLNSSFYLTIATPKGTTTKKVDGDMLSVGRAEDCNLSIAHETMSRRHLSVIVRDGQCYIEDHGSANGTFINGERLKAHAPVRVRPTDEVLLAQSGIRLSVSTEPVMRKEGSPPLPSDEKTTTAVNKPVIQTSSASERQEDRLAALPDKRSVNDSQKKAEELVLEAYKKAAQLVHESEIEAERKVEEIYKRAHDMQAKTERAYHEKLNEAIRSAENVFQTAQGEAHEILEAARKRANEIREAADAFVLDLRQKTEQDCERILGDAQELSRQLKSERMMEADEVIKRKEQEIIEKTKKAMDERLAQFEYDLGRQAEDRKAQIQDELKESIAKVERLKLDAEELVSTRATEETRLLEAEKSVETQKLHLQQLNIEIDKSTRALQDVTQKLVGLQTESDALGKERLAGREALKKMQDELRAADAKVKTTEHDVQSQMLGIRARFEEDKARLLKEEQRRLEEMKLETTRRVQKLEKELLSEIETKKDRMGREIMLLIETHLKQQADKSLDLGKLHGSLAKLLNEQIVMMSKDPAAQQKQASLVTLRRWEKARILILGCALGATLLLGAQHFEQIINLDVSPMQNQILTAIEQRKQDLEKRKFNPPQTAEYKSTYVDNVIYTENFAATYQNGDFQDALFKGLAPYMLRMWRMDEDKVIQLLSISSATVTALADKKENIHPDFVPQSIEKMRGFEKEAQGKMVALLGSQVRYESFKKFEAQFYSAYRPSQNEN